MSLSGIRNNNELDYPLTVRDAVTTLPFHYGGVVTLTSGQESDIVKVSDLRRFENMEEVARGTHTGASSTTTLTDSAASFVDWGIQVSDTIYNETDNTSSLVMGVSDTELVTDGITWANGDSYTVDKTKSHQNARAVEIRKFSILSDLGIYVRFDGAPSADLFSVEIPADDGYFVENARVVSRISAINIITGQTPKINIVCWGI